jgi:hypothetical protein
MLQINLRGEVKIGDFGMSVQLNSTLGRAFTWVGKVRPAAAQRPSRHGIPYCSVSHPTWRRVRHGGPPATVS